MIITAPNPIALDLNDRMLFLAGSINQGVTADWQSDMAAIFDKRGYMVLNPRREEWDASWVQSIDNPHFKEQVEWELSGLANSSFVFFYFHGDNMSPISLFELGYVINHPRPKKIIVVADEDYQRRGNLEVVCKRHSIPLFESLLNYLALDQESEGVFFDPNVF